MKPKNYKSPKYKVGDVVRSSIHYSPSLEPLIIILGVQGAIQNTISFKYVMFSRLSFLHLPPKPIPMLFGMSGV